jgi:hypothetical protein
MSTIHAAKPGIAGDHRTGLSRCSCDPIELVDINQPDRRVIVHRPMSAASSLPAPSVPADRRQAAAPSARATSRGRTEGVGL